MPQEAFLPPSLPARRLVVKSETVPVIIPNPSEAILEETSAAASSEVMALEVAGESSSLQATAIANIDKNKNAFFFFIWLDFILRSTLITDWLVKYDIAQHRTCA
jgi:hypothetical protein